MSGTASALPGTAAAVGDPLAAARIGVLGPTSPASLSDLLATSPPNLPPPRGLGGTPVNLMIRELIRRGRHVTVFSLDPSLRDERILEGPRLRICLGPFTSHRGRNWFRRERDYLARALGREAPDVLVAHWTYEYALAAAASGIPHLVIAHDAPWRILRFNPSPYRLVRTLMAYLACRRAQDVVAVSPHVAAHLRRWGFRRGSIEAIPNGLPDEIIDRVRPSRGDGPLVFGSVFSGGWQGLRNGAVLIRAFAEARQRLGPCRLLLMGDQCEQGGLADLWARARGLADDVQFLGTVPHQQVLRLLAEEVSVLVHPSREEACSMSLLEAAASALPIIAGRSSGAVPWLLGQGDWGCLVDVRSVRALSGAMVRLGRDPTERERLGQRAHAAAAAHFSLSHCVDRYEKGLAGLLAGR
jgi:glycosyltransferase involved in cell wall biosynthesis